MEKPGLVVEQNKPFSRMILCIPGDVNSMQAEIN